MASASTPNRIPETDAERLIAAHDGHMALLYIWQSVNPAFEPEKAAADLCLTAGDVLSAKEKLDRLLGPARPAPVPEERKEAPLPPAHETPTYSEEDVKRMLREGGEFQTIVGEASRIIGHTLSTPDLQVLLGIYDHLALPAEVIMELIHYCAERAQEKYGPGRRLSVRAIEKEAFRWFDEGILSFEAAERYISSQKTLRKDIEEIAEGIGLQGRDLSATQESYMRGWISLGFDAACVHEAYDRTMVNTGKLSWPYMNKILQAWHEKGLHSIREIREKDSRHPVKKQEKVRPAGPINPEDIFIFEKNEKK